MSSPVRTAALRSRIAAADGAHAQLDATLDLVDWLADADPRSADASGAALIGDAEAIGDPALLARAFRVRGHALLFTDPRRAYDELVHARRRYAALRRSVGVAWCDVFTGIALEYLGDPGGATVHAERALTAFRAAGELAGEARALNTLGLGQAIMGRDAECHVLFQRCAELAARVGDPVCIGLGRLNAAEARGRLGNAAAAEGRAEAAAAEFGAALAELRAVHEHAVRTGFTGLEPWALAFQVVPLAGLGRAAEAAELSDRAIHSAGSLDLDDAAAPALHHAGIARLATGDIELAAEHLRRALALYEQWDLTHVTVEVLRLLVDAEEKLGDLPAAFAAHKRLLVAVLRHRDAIAEREGQVVAARYEAERQLESAERGRRELQVLARTNRRLTGERRAMERLALTDPLTGLANRRHFDAQLTRLLFQSGLDGAQPSLVLVDIDHFKLVNDQHSHLVGDGVLQRLAAEMTRLSRASDLTARIGGEEFAVLLPGTAPAEARTVAERLRESVAALDLSDLAADLRVTVSAGVAGWSSGGPKELLAAADAALYAAKRAGRNRVCGPQPSELR
jgi:diguanylate cyclase (GGDEF)-like protein